MGPWQWWPTVSRLWRLYDAWISSGNTQVEPAISQSSYPEHPGKVCIIGSQDSFFGVGRGGGSFYVVFRGRGRCQYGLTALENGRIQPLGLGCASKCNASPMASYRWATSHRNTPTTTSNAEGPAVAQSTPKRVCSAPFSGKVSPDSCF